MVIDRWRWGFWYFSHVSGDIFGRLFPNCPGLNHLILAGTWLFVLLLGFPRLCFGGIWPFFHVTFLVFLEGVIFGWHRVVSVHVSGLVILGLPGLVQSDFCLIYLGCDSRCNEIRARTWGFVGLVLRMVQKTGLFGFNYSFVLFLGPDLTKRVLTRGWQIVLAVDALDLINIGLAIRQLRILFFNIRPVCLCVRFIWCNSTVYLQDLASCST